MTARSSPAGAAEFPRTRSSKPQLYSDPMLLGDKRKLNDGSVEDVARPFDLHRSAKLGFRWEECESNAAFEHRGEVATGDLAHGYAIR